MLVSKVCQKLDAAGGISPILEIHDNTLRECARVYLS